MLRFKLKNPEEMLQFIIFSKKNNYGYLIMPQKENDNQNLRKVKEEM